MERLQKVIANRGYCSRRKAEELILEGRVTVNGTVQNVLGIKVEPRDLIEIDGIALDKEEYVYYAFNKPRNVISAVSDPHGRAVITDYFEMVNERIYPIGRLDYDTTGLIILTNDGEFANLLMHPRCEVEKTYVARVEGILEKKDLYPLKRGVDIGGYTTAPAKAKIKGLDKPNNSTIVELVIHEGKYHQVKKMFEAIGHPVKRLKRTSVGILELGELKLGEYRRLKVHEVKQLRHLALYGNKESN